MNDKWKHYLIPKTLLNNQKREVPLNIFDLCKYINRDELEMAIFHIH